MGTELSTQETRWKTRAYVAGTLGGAVIGLIAAYLYSRASEEEIARGGDRPQIPTTTMIGLLLSALSLIRQIAEAGKPKK